MINSMGGWLTRGPTSPVPVAMSNMVGVETIPVDAEPMEVL